MENPVAILENFTPRWTWRITLLSITKHSMDTANNGKIKVKKATSDNQPLDNKRYKRRTIRFINLSNNKIKNEKNPASNKISDSGVRGMGAIFMLLLILLHPLRLIHLQPQVIIPRNTQHMFC